jgi:hypothetical protein
MDVFGECPRCAATRDTINLVPVDVQRYATQYSLKVV